MRTAPTTTTTNRRCTTRSRRPSVDPYCVEVMTWTREELLAARGMTARRPTRRHPKAA